MTAPMYSPSSAISSTPASGWFPAERWCGFNLLGMFIWWDPSSPPPKRESGAILGTFPEEPFRWMHDWGFNFARLPLDYRYWTHGGDWNNFDDDALAPIDQALEWGRKYGIHIQLNFHRAPGYCINPPREPKDLFRDDEARRVAACHWAHFARRYRGVPNERLSFDLLNEPSDHTQAEYDATHKALISAIRSEDPDRFIIANGGSCGRTPHPALYGLPGVGQAMRGYDPQPNLSHWHAAWSPADWDSMPPPSWPPDPSNPASGTEWLQKNVFDMWEEPRAHGVFRMANEFGCYNRTPHNVVLAWMEDMLRLWKERDIGWAMWNLVGTFGILDSLRADVEYRDFHGHKLDQKMLDLLLKYR